MIDSRDLRVTIRHAYTTWRGKYTRLSLSAAYDPPLPAFPDPRNKSFAYYPSDLAERINSAIARNRNAIDSVTLSYTYYDYDATHNSAPITNAEIWTVVKAGVIPFCDANNVDVKVEE